MALGGVPHRRQRGHVPVVVGFRDDRILHAMHRRVQMAPMHVKRRQLRIALRAPEIHHHVLGHACGQRLAALLADQVQREIDARGDARTRCELSIHDEHAVGDHLRTRREHSQRIEQLVMRGALASAEQSGASGEQCARADREQAVRRARRVQARRAACDAATAQ